MTILDGKATALKLQSDIKIKVEEHLDSGGKRPHLCAVLVGEDGASQAYVGNKIRACERVGFTSSLVKLSAGISESALIEKIESINKDSDIDGVIVQLPLPSHINESNITKAINPNKDVDGFHPYNVGKMNLGWDTYLSATPFGIIKLLEAYDIDTAGKHCVVLGRSNIVGRPMSILMARKASPGNCTVTLCHSRTKDIESYTKQADIVIVALGKPEWLKAHMIKDGAIIIDVGISRVDDSTAKRGYRLKGDVHFEGVSSKASYITPVPGGVGPMTVTALLLNTLEAAKQKEAVAL